MTISEILALPSDSSPRLIFATDEEKFYYIAAGAAGSTATWIANGAGGDFLPLAGGTMDSGADINFANASRLREGLTDAGNGGAGGVALVCSLDYEFKWEAGRLYVMGQDGFTIRVEQFGFTAVPTATDDDTKGYIVGSRRILDDGTIYICADATTGAAIWNMDEASLTFLNHELVDSSNYISIDWETRQLIASDGATVMLDWSNTYQLDIPEGMPLGVDMIYDAGTPLNYISLVGGQLGGYSGSNVMSLDWYNRQLYAPDGTTVIARWSNSTYFEANQIYGIDTSIGIDLTNSGLLDQGNKTLDWYARTLNDAAGNPIAKWGEDFSSGNYGIAFGPDGMGGFYHLLNVDGLRFLSGSLYSADTIDYGFDTAIDIMNRQLVASDGTTAAVDWSTGTPAFAQGASYTPTAYASLPASPVEGTVCYVNDADSPVSIGAVVTNGGTEKVLACFNGTDWKVIAHLS